MKLFHISCFITDSHLHDVMLLLEKYQARDLQVKTVRMSPTNGSKPNGRAPHTRYEETGPEIIAKIVAKGPLTWGEARAAFVKTGRRKTSFQTALQQAKEKKLIKRNSSGQYIPGSRA